MGRSADLPPGYDEEDPYEDLDLDELEPWWRENVELFRAHEMRPYRPPQFRDGELTPPVIERLEDDLGAELSVRVINPQEGNDWGIWLDGERIAVVERYRDEGGFSVYDLEAAEFEQLVRSHADGKD